MFKYSFLLINMLICLCLLLQKRALRLQEMKQKEALQREHIREAQLTREQELIAKPSNLKYQ